MTKQQNRIPSIPSVLSLPEKLERFGRRILKLRLPLERSFSLRDAALALLALLVILLQSLIPALRSLETPFCLAALALTLVPLALQALRLTRRKLVPAEEAAVFLAAALFFLAGNGRAAALAVLLPVLLWQVEAYSLLHLEAAPDTLGETEGEGRAQLLRADEEKSDGRRRAGFACVLLFGAFVLLGLIFALLTLFHLDAPGPFLLRAALALSLAGPSALLFSSRLTHFAALFCASKLGAVFRSDAVPERFARCRIFAFGKTGTVTEGKFQVVAIAPVGVSEEELLRIAAVAECRSTHPIGRTVRAVAGLKEGVEPSGLTDVEEVPGKGVSAIFSGHRIHVGNAALLEEHDIWYNVPSRSGTAIHVAVDGKYRGYLLLSDALRENAFEALEELRAHGATRLVMLTGDVRSVSRGIAASLNFDLVKSELSADEKASAVRYLRSEQGGRALIAAVGDGDHDAALFGAADVSVCLESAPRGLADLSICSDDLLTLPRLYRICRETERVFLLSVLGLAGVRLLLLILGFAGTLPPALVLILDFLFMAGAVLYALSCLTLERRG